MYHLCGGPSGSKDAQAGLPQVRVPCTPARHRWGVSAHMELGFQPKQLFLVLYGVLCWVSDDLCETALASKPVETIQVDRSYLDDLRAFIKAMAEVQAHQ